MKTLNIFESSGFSDKGMKKLLVHDSPYFRILNFNFEPGQSLPVHHHPVEGQLSILILEGEGEYLGGPEPVPCKTGDILVCDIDAPHGVHAITRLRVLVTIAPPI